jgi:hypothetical protein
MYTFVSCMCCFYLLEFILPLLRELIPRTRCCSLVGVYSRSTYTYSRFSPSLHLWVLKREIILWIREGIFSNKHLVYTYKIIISSIFGGLSAWRTLWPKYWYIYWCNFYYLMCFSLFIWRCYIFVYIYIYINGNTYKIYCLFLFISEILLYIPFRSITEL